MLVRGFYVFVYGIVLGCLTQCRTPAAAAPVTPPGQPGISCRPEEVQHSWAMAYPHVLTCMMAPIESPMTCLDGAAEAAHVDLEVVACVVRYIGDEARDRANRDPDDVITMRKAERAKVWLASRGLVFQ